MRVRYTQLQLYISTYLLIRNSCIYTQQICTNDTGDSEKGNWRVLLFHALLLLLLLLLLLEEEEEEEEELNFN